VQPLELRHGVIGVELNSLRVGSDERAGVHPGRPAAAIPAFEPGKKRRGDFRGIGNGFEGDLTTLPLTTEALAEGPPLLDHPLSS